MLLIDIGTKPVAVELSTVGTEHFCSSDSINDSCGSEFESLKQQNRNGLGILGEEIGLSIRKGSGERVH